MLQKYSHEVQVYLQPYLAAAETVGCAELRGNSSSTVSSFGQCNSSTGDSISKSSLLHDKRVAGLTAQTARKLLHMAARSQCGLHLHICSSFSLEVALQSVKNKHYATNTTNSSSSSSSSGGERCNAGFNSSSSSDDGPDGGKPDLTWLATLLEPRVSAAPLTMSLQQITTLWLQDMVLDHPMPECIGHTCPNLQQYGLQNVVWPDTTVTRCWPQVQQLTVQDMCTPQLAQLFNPATLPQLSKLTFKWSGAYDATHRALEARSAKMLGDCCYGFHEQLVTLELEGLMWVNVMVGCSNIFFPRLTCLYVSLHMLLDVFSLLSIVYTTPNLERLHFGALNLEKCWRQPDKTWERLQHLQIDTIVGDVMDTLSRLPEMPGLQMVTLPQNREVLVGADWLADVARVLNPSSDTPQL